MKYEQMIETLPAVVSPPHGYFPGGRYTEIFPTIRTVSGHVLFLVEEVSDVRPDNADSASDNL